MTQQLGQSEKSSTPFSVVDLFTIGIGPSSSHTIGPMRAAARFVQALGNAPVHRVTCELRGSLAATGKGHGTDRAIILGLMGHAPETIAVDNIPGILAELSSSGALHLDESRRIDFDPERDLSFTNLQPLPRHPNGMRLVARDSSDQVILEERYYSLGGGFVVSDSDAGTTTSVSHPDDIPYPFASAAELLEQCRQQDTSIAELTLTNEGAFREPAETRERLDQIWSAMQECVQRGCRATGTLPGGLGVKRRAGDLYRLLTSEETEDKLAPLDWVNLYALAVNEENAAGGRVVTAPTNGAAGIIPAVLHYARKFEPASHPDGIHRFLLTAGAIGSLYKRNASISGADVGCQGEIGVACSMAAGALVEYLGGSPPQVERAAEIGMEHNLGLTCDPVGGLVQVPCIERNAMASVKAINAARIAMTGNGSFLVSLDKVIQTMLQTGRDMAANYKETSTGGLAVNIIEC